MVDLKTLFNSAPSQARRPFLVAGQFVLQLDDMAYELSNNDQNLVETYFHAANFTIVDCSGVTSVTPEGVDTGSPLLRTGDCIVQLQKVETGLLGTDAGQKAVQRQMGNIRDMLLALFITKLRAQGDAASPTYSDISWDVFEACLGAEGMLNSTKARAVCANTTTKKGHPWVSKTWMPYTE